MSNFQYGANVHANGIRQHFLRYGGAAKAQSNTPIILVPGITSPAVTWGFVAEVLGQQYDTYVVDVRGRGLSDGTDDMDYSLTAYADDIEQLAKALGLAKYSVIGHSMGARIGACLAARKPQGLERLVMVDPPVSGPGRRAYPSKLPWYVDSIAMAQKGCSAEDMRAYCATWTDAQLQLRAEWLHTCNTKAIVTTFNNFHEEDFQQYLDKIAAPSMLMVAGRGDVIRTEDEQEMQKLLPGLAISRVPNAGHMIPWDDEAGFYSALGDFLGARVAKA